MGYCLIFAAAASCAAESEPEYFDGDRVAHIAFSVMFSAYDGVHDYVVIPYVPGATDGGDIVASSVRWEVDSSFVSREEFPDLPAAIKLTTKKPGKTVVTMIARHVYGNQLFRQRAALTITRGSAEDWSVGDNRYTGGDVVPLPDALLEPDSDACDVSDIDLSDNLRDPNTTACVSCHGDSRPWSDVTPAQTAGYSDSDLLEIITAGAQPVGGTYHSPCFSKLAAPDITYRALHSFKLSDEEKRGIVLKLRSLAPRVH